MFTWNEIKEDLRYPFGNPYKDKALTARDVKAVANLIHIARERLWLGTKTPGAPLWHEDYSEDLNEDVVRIVEESIQVLQDILDRETGNNETS